jgi:flagellar hook-length control protein FliK
MQSAAFNANSRVATPDSIVLDRARSSNDAFGVDNAESFREALRSMAARGADQALSKAPPPSPVPPPAQRPVQATAQTPTNDASEADTASVDNAQTTQQEALQRQTRANARKLPPAALARQAPQNMSGDSPMRAARESEDSADAMLRLIGEAMDLMDEKLHAAKDTSEQVAFGQVGAEAGILRSVVDKQVATTVAESAAQTSGTIIKKDAVIEAKPPEDGREMDTLSARDFPMTAKLLGKSDARVDDKHSTKQASLRDSNTNAHARSGMNATEAANAVADAATAFSAHGNGASSLSGSAIGTSSANSSNGATGMNSALGTKGASSNELQSFSQSLAAMNVSTPTAFNGLDSTTTAAPVPSAYISVPVGQAGWGNEISRAVIKLVERDLSEAKLTLNPEHFGPIDVSLDLQGAAVAVNFVAASAEARQALEQSLPQLAQMMHDAGISLSQSSVGQHAQGQSASNGARDDSGHGARASGTAQRTGGRLTDSGAGPVVRTIRVGGVDTFA